MVGVQVNIGRRGEYRRVSGGTLSDTLRQSLPIETQQCPKLLSCWGHAPSRCRARSSPVPRMRVYLSPSDIQNTDACNRALLSALVIRVNPTVIFPGSAQSSSDTASGGPKPGPLRQNLLTYAADEKARYSDFPPFSYALSEDIFPLFSFRSGPPPKQFIQFTC